MNTTILPVLWSVLRIGILIAIILLMKVFLVDLYRVTGPDMEPTLMDGSVILGVKYEKTLVPGQMIVYKREGASGLEIRRIVGIPGDTIEITDGTFYVNGEEESFLDEFMFTQADIDGFAKEKVAITVPANQFFVMGDNREKSFDSRAWGLVPKENVEATFLRCVLHCY